MSGCIKKTTGVVGRPRKNPTEHAIQLRNRLIKKPIIKIAPTHRRPVGRPRKLPCLPSTSSSSSCSDSSSDSESSDSDSDDGDLPSTEKITLNRKSVTLTTALFTDEDNYAHARKMEKLRRLKTKKAENGPVKVAAFVIRQLATASMKKIMHFYCYWKATEEDQDKARSEAILTKLRGKEVPKEMKKKINELIAKGIEIQIMKAENKRKFLSINKIKMYINEEQFGAPINDKALFDYSPVNVISQESSDKQLQSFSQRLNRMESKQQLCCTCVDKCDPSTCLCRGFQDALQNQKRPNDRRFYTCSPQCGCKGKCSSSLIDFSMDEGTEVMMHQNTEKGFAVRAKQYFGKGEMVSEMTGVITDTKNLPVIDDYSIDMTSLENDGNELNAILSNKNNTKPVRESIRSYPPQYMQLLKDVIDGNYSINPRDQSTVGRFISSSCFANVKPAVVFSNGLSPLNVRCMFRAIAPIFPNQEIAFTYSDEYIFRQLKDICTCGSLCCVSNRELYPFLRKEHFEKFYEQLYERLYKDYEENVIAPVDREPVVSPKRRNTRSSPVQSKTAKKRRTA